MSNQENVNMASDLIHFVDQNCHDTLLHSYAIGLGQIRDEIETGQNREALGFQLPCQIISKYLPFCFVKCTDHFWTCLRLLPKHLFLFFAILVHHFSRILSAST